MADSNTKQKSDQMAEPTTKLASIPSRLMGSFRRALSTPVKASDNQLERLESTESYYRKVNHNKWSFDYINNKSDDATIAEAQYAYFQWTEQLKENLQKEDRKENGLREYWTGIYQIIGFYSVFQGVIFQGVTSMATELSCGFYKIPIILSVLASAATFVGIYIKFNDILGLKESLGRDIVHREAIQAKIDFCEDKYEDVSQFNIETVEDKCIAHHDEKIKNELVEANLLKWGVLGFLVAVSGIFAYLDFVVMCKGYH